MSRCSSRCSAGNYFRLRTSAGNRYRHRERLGGCALKWTKVRLPYSRAHAFITANRSGCRLYYSLRGTYSHNRCSFLRR